LVVLFPLWKLVAESVNATTSVTVVRRHRTTATVVRRNRTTNLIFSHYWSQSCTVVVERRNLHKVLVLVLQVCTSELCIRTPAFCRQDDVTALTWTSELCDWSERCLGKIVIGQHWFGLAVCSPFKKASPTNAAKDTASTCHTAPRNCRRQHISSGSTKDPVVFLLAIHRYPKFGFQTLLRKE
jgi:hypothetical protein